MAEGDDRDMKSDWQLNASATEPATFVLLEELSEKSKLVAERLRRHECAGYQASRNTYPPGHNRNSAGNDVMAKLLDTMKLKEKISKYRNVNVERHGSSPTLSYNNTENLRPTNHSMQERTNDEMKHLKIENAELTKSIAEKQEQIDDLQLRLTRLSLKSKKADAENKEYLEILEMQIKAHRDDWEAEKQEKILAQNREAKAEEKLHETKTKKQELEERLRELENCSCMCHTTRDRGISRSEPIIRDYETAASYNFNLTTPRLPRHRPEINRIDSSTASSTASFEKLN